MRYGGNTACVALEVPGEDPVVLDLGTGLRSFARSQPHDGSFRGTALVTHLHFDHVQGLPFFAPADRVGAALDIYAPPQPGGLEAALDQFICPPWFPVRLAELRGTMTFNELDDGDLALANGAKVRARRVPHCGPTNGYRIEWEGVSVAYVSDHQSPRDGGAAVDEGVLELCDGADLVIHDAQYTPEEWAEKSHWGHCSIEYALSVAEQAGARRLALFHHDPGHDDDTLDRLVAVARERAAAGGVEEVLGATEGLTISFER